MRVSKGLRSAIASAAYLARKSVHSARRDGWRGFSDRARRKLFPPRVYAPAWSKTYSAQALALAEGLDFSPDDLAASRATLDTQRGPLRIGAVDWFLPRFEYAYYGGIHTVLRFADHFARHHGVRSVFVVFGDPDETAAAYAARIAAAFPALAGSQVVVVRFPDDLRDLPAADASVATLWQTAYYALKFNRVKRKFYMLQDFEPLFYPAGSACAQAEATYRFGFYGLANTIALKQIYEEHYQGQAIAFDPCVDVELFYPPTAREWQRPREPLTLFFYARPDYARNGFELGVAALRKLKERLGRRVRIVSAGQRWNPADYGLAGVVEHLGLLSYRETAALYRTCDAGLVMMFTRHPSYLPFEMMASGCLVISNLNEATSWFLKDGENCLLAQPSASCIADVLARGLEDETLRQRIVGNAWQTIREQFADWDRQIERVYAYMCDPQTVKRFPQCVDRDAVN